MNRVSIVWRALFLLGGVAGFSHEAGASSGEWVLLEQHFVNGSDLQSDTCSSPYGHAASDVSADGFSVNGEGFARDGSFLCDVRSISAVAGLKDEIWIFSGEGQGRVLVYAQVFVRGTANLADPTCAAAGLGFAEFSSNLTQPIRAVLDRSAAETSSELLGTLRTPYDGFGLSVPISIGSGEGSYSDESLDSIADARCTNTFFWKALTFGYIHVFANASGLDDWAESSAEVCGYVNVDYTLDVCACPSVGPAPTPGGIPGGGGVTPAPAPTGGVTPRPSGGGGTTPDVARPNGGGTTPGGGPR